MDVASYKTALAFLSVEKSRTPEELMVWHLICPPVRVAISCNLKVGAVALLDLCKS